MKILDADVVSAMHKWRHQIHARPELAYAEHLTADLVAHELAGLGLNVHRGLGRTGVVVLNKVEVTDEVPKCLLVPGLEKKTTGIPEDPGLQQVGIVEFGG